MKPNDKLSIWKVKGYESEIDTLPSHDIIFTDSLSERLIDIVDYYGKSQGLNPTDIPADILLESTISIPDLYIRMEEFSARARIVIFDYPKYHSLFRKEEFIVMGAVIYDYGNTMPEMFFGVKYGDSKLYILDDLWWYGSKSKKQNTLFMTRFGKENLGQLQMTEYVLRLWYGIQHVNIHRTIYSSEAFQLKQQIYRSIDELKLFPNHIICETNPEKEFQRHKLYWFQPGHFKTVYLGDGTPTIVWIDGGWRYAHQGNEKSPETIDRIKRNLENKHFKVKKPKPIKDDSPITDASSATE